jgi:hypothetical protein
MSSARTVDLRVDILKQKGLSPPANTARRSRQSKGVIRRDQKGASAVPLARVPAVLYALMGYSGKRFFPSSIRL